MSGTHYTCRLPQRTDRPFTWDEVMALIFLAVLIDTGFRLAVCTPPSIGFQTFALFPWLSVLINIILVQKVKGLHRAVEPIDRAGLDGFETAYLRKLSVSLWHKIGLCNQLL